MGCVLLVGYLANFIVACIALSESSAETVMPVCGDGVRVAVLLHVIFTWAFWVPVDLFLHFRWDKKSVSDHLQLLLSGLVLVCTVSVLAAGAVMSITVAQRALGDANCTAVLSEGSRYQAPVLAHMCYVYCVLDVIGVVSMIALLISNCEFMCMERHWVYVDCEMLYSFFECLLAIGAAVNFSVDCVALDLSSGPAVAAACGKGLWRVVLGQLLCFYAGWIMPLLLLWAHYGPIRLSRDAVLYGALFIAVVVCVMTGVGGYYSYTYAHDALSNTNCTAALSAVNSMGVPMLAHVGYSHFAIDMLFLLATVGALIGYVVFGWTDWL